MRSARDKLIFMGLVALHQATERARSGPYDPPFALRVVLAMLHALAGGNRDAFDGFYRALHIPNDNRGHVGGANERSNQLHSHTMRIFRQLGVPLDSAFSSDINRALDAPLPQHEFYEVDKRKFDPPNVAARKKFADRLRTAEQRRLAHWRENGWRTDAPREDD